ncbi:MAG TPA: alpha-L-fucosidase [Chitinophagaceae bacterium]|nr:alpha-L-fucosidase [Chitinophagaceae bacterium]
MKKLTRWLLLLILLQTQVTIAEAQNRYQATWQSLENYKTPDWFRDAKFGIFIHWGVYSVPAYSSEWYPRQMYLQGSDEFKHHVATYGPQNKFGYKDFIPMFKAEKFDPEQWADLFEKAGAKYVVPVAEHHDGFAMYKTALSKWNAAEMGPHRDIIGELSAAIKKHNLIFGLSSHRIEHWWFMNGGRRFDSDVNDPKYADFYGPAREENETPSPEYMNDWLLRCTELVNKYQPQLFWFDWWIEQPAMDPYRKSFAAYYYNKGLEWGKGVVLNYKNISFPEKAAVLDIERGKLKGIRDLPWQTDDAVGFKSWGYIPDDEYKSPKYLVTNLVDIVSKNGNLLLNIGPKSDGTIPEEQQQLLLAIGRWLKINGEAIYGTRPWKTYGEGPTEVAAGSFVDRQLKPFTPQDVRFTTKGDTLYTILLDIPTAAVTVKSLATTANNGIIETIEMVGSDEPVLWKQTAEGLVIQPVKQYPSEYAVAYRVRMKK